MARCTMMEGREREQEKEQGKGFGEGRNETITIDCAVVRPAAERFEEKQERREANYAEKARP